MARDIQVGTQRIRLDDVGAGTPAVLLHSSGLSGMQWRRLKEKLSAQHRVLVPDLVGYGASAPWAGPGDFHLATDVEVVEAVAQEAGEPVHLVGHSYGGLLALKAALGGRFPIASLFVFEPVAFGVLFSSGADDAIAQLAALGGDAFFDAATGGDAAWCERFVDYWSGRGFWARMPEQQRASFLAAGRKMFQEVRDVSYDRTPHEAYARITAPTLVLSGSLSPLAGRRTAEIVAQSIPHARFELLEGAGHMAPLTHAELVNGRIAAHVDDADRARR